METSSLLLVGNDEKFLAAAGEAARLAFPQAAVRNVSGLEEALRADPADGLQLLVLADPAAADIQLAVSVLDSLRLPRWAVVVFGDSPADLSVESLPRGEWQGRLAARAMRSAAAQHRLRRENARLRGDLATLGIRFAHDLRTPLGCILTSAEALQESLAADPKPDAGLIGPIVDSGADLVKLIQQMSLLTKATAAAAPRQRCDMGAAVWAACERLEGRILKSDAVVTKPDAWPEVMGDPSWLESIWWNLIDNGLRYAKGQPRIDLGWRREGSEFQFWSADTGVVAPEKQAGLFAPFHRLHEANAGRGFGLAIVRRLLELQGGRCDYHPRSEGGSTFRFTLPIADCDGDSGRLH